MAPEGMDAQRVALGEVAAKVMRNTIEQTAQKMRMHTTLVSGAFAIATLLEAKRNGWTHKALREAVDAAFSTPTNGGK